MQLNLLQQLDHQTQALQLPALEITPINCSIGKIHHVLRGTTLTTIQYSGEVQISSRRKEVLLTFENNEKIILTTKRNLACPPNADGVLYKSSEGTLIWQNHRLIEEFKADIDNGEGQKILKKIKNSWNGQFVFKSEHTNSDGSFEIGLRPPQIGALHAIGAHWSLYQQPATIVMPTGTGKTETMLSTLAAYVRGTLLVVVPSDVLRSQTFRKFLTFGLLKEIGALLPGALNPIVGIVTKRPRSQADLEIFDRCNVIIGTMSALAEGNAEVLVAEIAKKIDTLIVDEAHHIGAKGWTRFREAFQASKVLQFTATPFRRDSKLVDGTVIYTYPLVRAQKDGYFKKITFEPIHEINPLESDNAIALAAIGKLRLDIANGLNHLLMARCSSIGRATTIYDIYLKIAPDLNPILIHSDLGDTDLQLNKLRSGHSRIVICVNMLGEGFDLPELKIAAIHDLHKSLAILLQFTGRFTRSSGISIGDATVIANISDPDLSPALERLYSEDADWNQVLSELSSNAAKEHAELIAFLNTAQRLDASDKDETISISQQLLRPTLSTLIFEAKEFHPKRFHEGLTKGTEVHRVWLHQPSSTLFFVTRHEPIVKWTRSRSVKDLQWSLFILHFDPASNLLFLSSTDHNSNFENLASAVGASKLISGDNIFRALGSINRLIFQNIGVKKHGRRNLRYAMYTGADVANALSLSEQAGSIKSNLSGTGWEDGKPVTIGCSYKGRIWSREQGPIPRFIQWCKNVGSKVIDEKIDTKQIIANVLIPEEVFTLPDTAILSLEWPLELLTKSEEQVILNTDGKEQSLTLFDIQLVPNSQAINKFEFQIIDAGTGLWGIFKLALDQTDGFKVIQISGDKIDIRVGTLSTTLEDYFSNYPPLVRFIDLTELDGNLLIRPQNPQELVIPEECFEIWSWEDVDIEKESIWKDGEERLDSIQWHTAQQFINDGFSIVFDDDSAGEAADLVCLKEETDHVRLALIHCKFSGGSTSGERVKDVVEVCSQAVRSAKWKWKFRDLCKHLLVRENKLTKAVRQTRFLTGRPVDINHFLKISRFKEIRAQILIVQPGLSKQNRTNDQSAVLAAAMTYLKETIAIDLNIVCSA
jgi:hypothetical protein